MKVKVYPGPFSEADTIDEDGFVYLEDGATLRDLYKVINIKFPFTRLGLCSVNHKSAKINAL